MARSQHPERDAWLSAFGARVRRLRQERGLSQLDFALEIGIDPTYLSSIENGRRNTTLVMIHILAAGLVVAPSALLSD